MPELVSSENLLVKLKKIRSSKMHQVVKIAETTVASIKMRAIKLEGRLLRKVFKGHF